MARSWAVAAFAAGAAAAAVAAASATEGVKQLEYHAVPARVGAAVADPPYPVINIGSTISGRVSNGQYPFSNYAYYQFYTSSNTTNMVVSLVSLSGGDADLVVSDQSIIPTPTVGNTTYSSLTNYAEAVYIPGSACANSEGCTYTIGVAPFTASTNISFLLSVYVDGNAVPLADGEPFEDAVIANAQLKYVFSYAPVTLVGSVTVSLETQSGLAAVFASFDCQDNNWPRPGPGNAQFVQYGSGTLELPLASAQLAAGGCPAGGEVSVHITTLGLTTAYYTLTVASGMVPVQLVAGQPTAGLAPAGGYAYYSYTNAYAGAPVAFYITPLSGDPDVFVSVINPAPSWTNFTWYSAGFASEVITVQPTDPNYAAPPSTYYIGVYGYYSNATFTITPLELMPQATIALASGQPQAGATPAGHTMAYFTFNVSSNASEVFDVDLLATPLVNDVDIYVSTVPGVFPMPRCNGTIGPTGCRLWVVDPATYTLSNVGQSANVDFLTVPAARQTVGTAFIVAIFATTVDTHTGRAGPSTFVVTATLAGSATELQTGVPVQGVVQPGGMRKYMFDTTAFGSDLVVSATLESGAVTLYASESWQVGPGSSTWNSSANGGIVTATVVYIPFTSLSPACQLATAFGSPCRIFLAVVGYSNMPVGALYSLTAGVAGSPAYPNTLPSGVVTRSTIPAGGYGYYTGAVNMAAGKTIFVVAQSWTGETDLWVTLGVTPGATFASPANGMTADIHSTDLGGYARAAFLPPGAQPFALASAAAAAGVPVAVAELPTAALAAAAGARDVTVPVVDGGRTVRTLSSADAADRAYLTRYAPGALATTPYCTNCTLYMTVGATAGVASDFSLYFQGGSTFMQLDSGAMQLGYLGVNDTAYYTFAATDPAADVTVQIDLLDGSVNAFILVQSPIYPYATPNAFSYQWRVLPWTGATTLTINHTDPNFCVSRDGNSAGAPCTFIIGIYNRFPRTKTAFFAITATASEAAPLQTLLDGETATGSVAEGQYQYFYFVASTDVTNIVSPVLIQAETMLGRVELYVTNAYLPGITDSSYLPSANNPSGRCQWSASQFPALLINSSSPCFMAGRQAYTIAVYGHTGNVGAISSFQIQAADNALYLLRTIDMGEPLPSQFVRDNQNANYSFYLSDLSDDLVIAATATFGDVVIMVSPHNSTTGAPPYCWAFSSSTQVRCNGAVWTATGQYGASAMYIPVASPCSPFAGAGMPAPTVDTTQCGTALHPGRYFVTVYGMADAEFSVSVQQAGQVLELADGQPQLTISTPVVFCTSRDPWGNCNDGSMFVRANATFVSFTVPATMPQVDQYVVVERLCANGGEASEGACGSPLHMYASSCVATECATMDSYPYWEYSVADAAINASFALGTLTVPSCYAGVTPGFGAAPCVYTINILPVCGGTPGSRCSAAITRVTWSGDSTAERISADCYTGRTCVVPQTDIGPTVGAVRRYEAFAGAASTEMVFKVQACTGTVVVYVCYFGTCSPMALPSAGNAAITVTTSTSGAATAVVDANFTGPVFLGLAAAVGSIVPDPTFLLSVSLGGAGVSLAYAANPGSNTPAATWVAGGLEVGWQAVTLALPGGAISPATNTNYLVYAFPSPLPTSIAGFNLGAGCGAVGASTALSIAPVTSRGTGVLLPGLSSSQAYTIVVAAFCYPGSCLPAAEVTAQSLVFTALNVPAVGPAPSASPSPAAGGGGSHGGSGGAVAGGVIGGLAALALAGGFIWWYRRPRSTTRGSLNRDDALMGDSAYAPML